MCCIVGSVKGPRFFHPKLLMSYILLRVKWSIITSMKSQYLSSPVGTTIQCSLWGGISKVGTFEGETSTTLGDKLSKPGKKGGLLGDLKVFNFQFGITDYHTTPRPEGSGDRAGKWKRAANPAKVSFPPEDY